MDMHPTCPRDEWVERLSVEVASAAFPTAGDLAPEEEAVVFGEILDARVPQSDLLATLRKKENPN